MARGQYWHVKAYMRAVTVIGFAVLLSHYVLVTTSLRVLFYETGTVPYGWPAEVTAKYPLLTELQREPYYSSFGDFLLRAVTYEPILAVLVGGVLCTVALEMRERRRRREP